MGKLNQKGESKANYIIGFTILFLAIYAGFKFFPVMIRVYAFADKVNEEAKYLHGRKVDQLEKDIYKQARIQDRSVDSCCCYAHRLFPTVSPSSRAFTCSV